MGIFTRMIGIFKADIHGVMDSLEDKQLLVKQHLRDMEESLDRDKVSLENLVRAKEDALKKQSRYQAKEERLEQDISYAIEKSRDDTARLLIRKQKHLQEACERLAEDIRQCEEEICTLKEGLDARESTYDHLRLKADAVFRAKGCQKVDGASRREDPMASCFHVSDAEIDLELALRKDELKRRR